MNNIYYRDIIELLLPYGQEGMKLSHIVKHVYNNHVDMFENNINYEELYKTIGTYLWKQSQKRESPFIHNTYGIYAIKPDMAVQLDLFWDMPEDTYDAEESNEKRPDNNKIVQMEFFKQQK